MSANCFVCVCACAYGLYIYVSTELHTSAKYIITAETRNTSTNQMHPGDVILTNIISNYYTVTISSNRNNKFA